MKKQARIDVRDYFDLNTGIDVHDFIKSNIQGIKDSLINHLSEEGKSSADILARIVGDKSGAIHKTPMKIKGLGDLQKVIDAYNQYYPEMNTQVQLGMVDAARNIDRAEAMKPSFFTKMLGRTNLDSEVAKALEKGRTDHFMPLSNTVHVFSENPSILAHELGHAADFTYRHKGSPGRMLLESNAINILPFLNGLGNLDQEMAATNNAWKALRKAGVSEDMMRDLSKNLSGAGGTYAGSMVGGRIGALLGGLGGAVLNDPGAIFFGVGMGNQLGSQVGLETGAFAGRNAGKFIDIPKWLMSATLPEPKPVSDRLKIHATDILNDLKTGNILKYPRDSFNSAKYVFNDIKEMAKAKLLALAKHFK